MIPMILTWHTEKQIRQACLSVIPDFQFGISTSVWRAFKLFCIQRQVGGWAQWVECLPGRHKGLGFIPSTA